MRILIAMAMVGMLSGAASGESNCATTPHECGKGPVKVTKRYEKQSVNQRAENCFAGDTSITRVDGSIYKSSPSDLSVSYSIGYYDAQVHYYMRDCEQDIQYTDWPECGGQQMYPLSVPRDQAKCTCPCGDVTTKCAECPTLPLSVPVSGCK